MQDRQRFVAEMGVDRARQVGQPVGGELDVEVTDGSRFVPRLGGFRRLVVADARQRGEGAMRVFGDQAQHLFSVQVGEALSPGLADVAQRGQVADVPLAVGRVQRLGALHLQLPSVALVGGPLAADLRVLADREVGDGTDQDHPLA